MGSRGDSGASGSDAGFENSVKQNQNKKNKFTNYTKDVTNPNDDTEAKASLFEEQGATNIKNSKVKTVGTAILEGALKEGSRVNRRYFKDEVLGKGAFKDTSVKDFERKTVTEQEKIYKDYFDNRMSGKTDNYGRPIDNSKSVEQPRVASQMDNSDVKSTMITADKTSPTDIEFTQDQSALETKKRGRKRTILTSVTGDTSNVTLSKKTLLGS